MQDLFENILKEKPSKITPISGGDINEVYEVESSKGVSVFKINDASRFPEMLALEANGLNKIASTNTVRTPEVLAHGVSGERQFLQLEKISTGNATSKTWQQFGEALAKLHEHTHMQFGSDHSNYIGSLVQQNNQTKTWTEFLITQRLQPMLELAVNQGDVNYVEAKIFDGFFNRVDELFPIEKPSLLHGDLWSGNFLTDAKKQPVLIDPAVYYGHREMDIAMMHLFGGFPATVFDSYNESYPLEKHWQKRIELNQLYPLLVHVNLFGRSYWEKVRSIVEPFG